MVFCKWQLTHTVSFQRLIRICNQQVLEAQAIFNFNSNVNPGSDKGFLLFQDESALLPGTSSEDVRFTIGVFNDFRSIPDHSDELWFQGGGRLVQNVGLWDAELNSLIGIPGVGTTGDMNGE